MTLSTKIDFKPGGPFHDMVTAYMAALGGLVVLAPSFPVDLSRVKPIGLASKIVGAVEFPLHETKVRLGRGDFSLDILVNPLGLLLANGAYERVKAVYAEADLLTLRQANPELEFLRHLRNAASHGGKWHFLNGEPVRKAEWRGKALGAALHGRPIWDAGIAEGDLLLLLHDAEQILLKSPPKGGWA